MRQTVFYGIRSGYDNYVECFIDASVIFPTTTNKLLYHESSFRHWNLTVTHRMDFYYVDKQNDAFVFNFLKVVEV